MDLLRAAQLLTNLAYVLIGVAAVGAAVRWPDRARTDVALVFGALAGAVVLQELSVLGCAGGPTCLPVPGAAALVVTLALALPYLLVRLVDDVVEIPTWATRATL